MKFDFEPLQNRDVDVCLKTVISSLRSQRPKINEDKETIKKMIFGEQVLTIVAKKNGKIVGLISGTLPMQPKITFITVTDKQSAREGLNGFLIDRFLKTVKKHASKAKFVLHNDFAENYNGVGLFSIKGFMVTGFIRDEVTGHDVVFMKKPL